MSTVSRNCQNRAQRLRGECENTASPPGSRWTDPWVLRPKRGFPQFTPKLQRILIVQGFALAGMGCLGPDASVLERPDREMWRARVMRAKTAASCLKKPGGSLRASAGWTASCRTLFPLYKRWREAGRETYPPSFPSALMHPP